MPVAAVRAMVDGRPEEWRVVGKTDQLELEGAAVIGGDQPDKRASLSYRDAMQQLRGAQKSGKGAPAYSLYVNRPLGRRFAAAAYVLRLTPNQVTAISAVFTFTGIILLATLAPSVVLGIAVALCLVIGYALDSADGQLSRLRGGGSVTGEWLDHIIDAAKVSALHVAVVISFAQHLPWHPAWLLVPLGFIIVDNVEFFGQLLNEQLGRVERLKAGVVKPPSEETSWIRSLAKLPTDYGVLCVVFVLYAWLPVFFYVYTFLFVAKTGYLLLALVKWYGDMRGLDRLRGAS